jgi:GH24 family phage-related lysozyme (muramidase)
MTKLDLDAVYKEIAVWEGEIAHMYLDQKGYVTIGAGNLLSSAGMAKKLLFVDKLNNNEPATPEQIEDAYNKVASMEKGKSASFYKIKKPSIGISKDVIKSWAVKRLDDEFIPFLNKLYKEFGSFPSSAQLALIDMVYCLGCSKLAHSFPNFNGKILKQDWNGAAEGCHISSAREERNDWHKELFLKAV